MASRALRAEEIARVRRLCMKSHAGEESDGHSPHGKSLSHSDRGNFQAGTVVYTPSEGNVDEVRIRTRHDPAGSRPGGHGDGPETVAPDRQRRAHCDGSGSGTI